MGLKTLNVMGKSQKEVNDSLPIKVKLSKLNLIYLIIQFDAVIECTGRHECIIIAIYAAKPGSKVVLVGLGQRDKMYELPITHAAVSLRFNSNKNYPIQGVREGIGAISFSGYFK